MAHPECSLTILSSPPDEVCTCKLKLGRGASRPLERLELGVMPTCARGATTTLAANECHCGDAQALTCAGNGGAALPVRQVQD